MPYTPRHSTRGFTLIEVMIVVAIISILAKVALPAYVSYMNKSRARAAAADLSTLALNMENGYQLSLSYTSYASTTPTSTNFPAWQSTQGAYFSYLVNSTTSTYNVQAIGNANGPLSGCTLTLYSSGTKVGSGCPFSTW